MENPEKISLQFELLNTYYSKIACKMSHTPFFHPTIIGRMKLQFSTMTYYLR